MLKVDKFQPNAPISPLSALIIFVYLEECPYFDHKMMHHGTVRDNTKM